MSSVLKTVTNIAAFKDKADADGYVPLKAFANKVFRLNDNALSGYFDPSDRFYESEDSKMVRENIRHNVTLTLKPVKKINPLDSTYTHYKLVKGGIHQDDLEAFIKRVNIAIERNNAKFAEVIEEYNHNINLNAETVRKSPIGFWSKLFK